MHEYTTQNPELIKAIDGIPIPDITLSSLSQQSSRVNKFLKKEESLISDNMIQYLKQTRKIDKEQRDTQQIQNLFLKSLSPFQNKENTNQNKILKNLNITNLQQNNLELIKLVESQKQEIQLKISIINDLQQQIEQLTIELQEKKAELQSNTEILQQLNTINTQQQQIIENIPFENFYKQKLNQLSNHQEGDQIIQLYSQIKNLESEINKTRTTFSFFSPKNETLEYKDLLIKNRTFYPELLSEQETVSTLFNLLNRISKSQRMISLLQKNVDFIKLIKFKPLQQSQNRISHVNNIKSQERNSSQNVEKLGKLLKPLQKKFN
ncbi:unnamed protein product [Paramecium primaurelia]|uniref:Uncharacterized protein n=1 Tax=Paramecium primaurelia TaxID=5886 RepID=A0A8S1JT19_PARPR|nr:unnamed protein product [Paramecium primaurelia]